MTSCSIPPMNDKVDYCKWLLVDFLPCMFYSDISCVSVSPLLYHMTLNILTILSTLSSCQILMWQRSHSWRDVPPWILLARLFKCIDQFRSPYRGCELYEMINQSYIIRILDITFWNITVFPSYFWIFCIAPNSKFVIIRIRTIWMARKCWSNFRLPPGSKDLQRA